MRSRKQTQTEKYVKEHQKRKWWQRGVSVLAAIAVFCTTYAMILPAITWERSLVCELPEHHHEESCYEVTTIPAEKELVCLDEEHVHTDECYETIIEEHEEKVLVCQLEEHEHSAACFDAPPAEDDGYYCGQIEHIHSEKKYCFFEDGSLKCSIPEHVHSLACKSNPKADVENEAAWVSSFASVSLTGNWAEDVIAIAKTQIGYTESTQNYEVQEDGSTIKGYTRYGDWYGIEYGDWCAMFCAFCQHYAGVKSAQMPISAGCESWVRSLKEKDLYHEVNSGYEPIPGDLIFFDWDEYAPEHPEARKADHVGLVYEINKDSITTIEGNWSDCVCTIERKFSDGKILGYGELPENPDYATIESAPASDGAIAVISGYLPEGAEAVIEEIPYTGSDLTELLGEETASSVMSYVAYDITIWVNGEEWQPDATVSVVIKHPDIEVEDSSSLAVAHVNAEADTVSDITAEINDDGDVTFETDGFSTYILYVSGNQATVNLACSDVGDWYLVKTPASELRPGDSVLVLSNDESVILYPGIDTAWPDTGPIPSAYTNYYGGVLESIEYDGKTYYPYDANLQDYCSHTALTVTSSMGLKNCNGKILDLNFNADNRDQTFFQSGGAVINADGTITQTIGGTKHYLTFNPATDAWRSFRSSTSNSQYAQLVFYRLEQFEAPEPEDDDYQIVDGDGRLRDLEDFTYRTVKAAGDACLYHTNTVVTPQTPFANGTNDKIEFYNAFVVGTHTYNVCMKVKFNNPPANTQLYWGAKTYSTEWGYISLGQFRNTPTYYEWWTEADMYEPETDIDWELWLEDANGNRIDDARLFQETGYHLAGGSVYVAPNEYVNVYSRDNTLYTNVPEGIVFDTTEGRWHTIDDAHDPLRGPDSTYNLPEDYLAGITSPDGVVKGAYRKGYTDAGCELALGTYSRVVPVEPEEPDTVKLTITKEIVGVTSTETFPFEVTLKDGNGQIVKLTAGTYTAQGSVSYTVDINGKITFALSHGQSVIIDAIPIGTIATVTETQHNGFNVKFTDPNGYVNNSATDNFNLTNAREITVTNMAGAELPATGGIGVYPIYALGALLVAGPIVYGCILRRKRERRAK